MSDPRAIVQRLRALVQVLDGLSDEQLAEVLLGASRREVVGRRSLPAPVADLETLERSLTAAASREAARGVLLPLKRDQLVGLARRLKVAAGSKDKVEVIRDKLVAATVGARLDAIAIHQR
jgi:hypothetical protein